MRDLLAGVFGRQPAIAPIFELSLSVFRARCFQRELRDIQVFFEIRKSLGLIPNVSRAS